MGSHSETASRKSVDAAFESLCKRADDEQLSTKLDAGFDNIDRKLRRLIWKVAGLYAYLLAWLIWFYYELRSKRDRPGAHLVARDRSAVDRVRDIAVT